MVERGYEICIRGRLDAVLMDELSDLDPQGMGATSCLTVATDDQATLHGTMACIRDLGLVIESVSREDGGSRESPPDASQADDY